MRPLLFCAGLGAVLTSMVIPLPSSGADPTASTAPPPASPGRWRALDSGTTADLKAVSFSDARAGHVVGVAGTILSTADGGKTWRRQFACTRTKPCQDSSEDRITVDLTGVGFWSPARGVAVGAGGTILSTANGGKTWTPRAACEGSDRCETDSSDRTTADLTAVAVTAPSHAYAVGKAGTMLASDDFGRTWRRLVTCGIDPPDERACRSDATPEQPVDLTGVTAPSVSVMQAVGDDGAFFETRDAGKTFRPNPICTDLSLPPGARPPFESGDSLCTKRRIFPDLRAVSYPHSRRRGAPRTYAVGAIGTILAYQGTFAGTAQAACATAEQCAPSSPHRVLADLRAVTFPVDLTGYAVGAGGTVVSLKLPSPGSDLLPRLESLPAGYPQWRPEDSGTTKDLNGVSFPSPAVGYAVGDDGTVLKRDAAAPGVRFEKVRPARGLNVGRTEVKITGEGFTGATDVYFGPTRALGFTVVSGSQITATAPDRPAGTVQVTVATPAGPSPAVAAGRFTYVAPAGGKWTRAATCPSGCGGSAVALPDGKVLLAGDSRATRVYDPATRIWADTAPLTQRRQDYTTTALADGRVLVAGGIAALSSEEMLANLRESRVEFVRGAEVYDPAVGTWSPAGEMNEPRTRHSATLLADGRVLAVGGNGPGGGLLTAEVWDPRSRTWSPTSPISVARSRPTATNLPGGKVLVVGGFPAVGLTASDEIYDPASGRWRNTAAPKTPHAVEHTLTLMGDGTVLVAGGKAESQNTVPFAQRYDPKSDNWTATAPMRVPRASHGATALGDGRVLVTGGVTDDPAQDTEGEAVASAEIYDPQTDRWSLVADMPVPLAPRLALLLRTGCGRDCGKVLVVSGQDQYLYEPPTAAAEANDSKDQEAGLDAGAVIGITAGIAVLIGALLLVMKVWRR